MTRYVTETHAAPARISRITAHLPVLTARFAADRPVDPVGQPLEQVRCIRDDLDTRVRQLLNHMRSTTAGIAT